MIDRLRAEPNIVHGVEKAMHGPALVQDIRREVKTALLREVRPDKDKVTRANLWLPMAEAGKVILVQGNWIEAFVDEVCRFPTGKHDDQVDAVSLAVRMLSRKKRGGHSFT